MGYKFKTFTWLDEYESLKRNGYGYVIIITDQENITEIRYCKTKSKTKAERIKDIITNDKYSYKEINIKTVLEYCKINDDKLYKSWQNE